MAGEREPEPARRPVQTGGLAGVVVGRSAIATVGQQASGLTYRGYGIEAKLGHITIVIDRASRELVGAAVACPDASAAIHDLEVHTH